MKKIGDNKSQFGLKVLLYFILILMTFLFAFPFYYVFVLASQEGTNMYVNPPHIFFGKFYFENIGKLFEEIPFGIHFLNSVLIGVFATVTTAFFCTMCKELTVRVLL
jgi:ABC-type glycerol-3-phosphate transport system permease component